MIMINQTDAVSKLLSAFGEFNRAVLEECDELGVVDGYVMSGDAAYFITHLSEKCRDENTSMEALDTLCQRIVDVADEEAAAVLFTMDILDALSAFNRRLLGKCDKLTVVDGYVMNEDVASKMAQLDLAAYDYEASYSFATLLIDITKAVEHYSKEGEGE